MTPAGKPASSGVIGPLTVAIVPAAGLGKRLALKTRKPFVLLKGKPIIAHTIGALEACQAIDEIMVATEKACVKKISELIKRYRFKKVRGIVVGGKTRFESVRNCLSRIGPSCGMVVVHDGARPLIDGPTIKAAIKLAGRFGACIVAVPESDTVKLTDKKLFIRKTLDRRRLYRAQTPQVFRYDIIKRAYETKGIVAITDDASLVEYLGKKVKILVGSYRNIKITTREDIRIAEALL